jgi:hypothetical protein
MIQSYVTGSKTFCIYLAESNDATGVARSAAGKVSWMSQRLRVAPDQRGWGGSVVTDGRK